MRKEKYLETDLSLKVEIDNDRQNYNRPIFNYPFITNADIKDIEMSPVAFQRSKWPSVLYFK